MNFVKMNVETCVNGTKMMKRKRTERPSNNNINVIYLFTPDYTISKKLDFITLL